MSRRHGGGETIEQLHYFACLFEELTGGQGVVGGFGRKAQEAVGEQVRRRRQIARAIRAGDFLQRGGGFLEVAETILRETERVISQVDLGRLGGSGNQFLRGVATSV